MQRTSRYALMIASLGLLAAPPLSAFDGIVEKQRFRLENFTTQGGETIPQVDVGWEAYGELNDARDNVILITHFFSGTSHAAGRYSDEDALPGYWDAIIGPGKALDTDRFYIISSDTLVNLNAHDPNVVTTGPATINPETGEPWGMAFPLVGIRDFVEVQRALLESQGIDSLYAVMGASMGALQAIEWASVYPQRVERLIPVIGSGATDPWLLATLGTWAVPIRLDERWNEGDYYDAEPPLAGLKEALKLVTLNANHWRWANRTFDRAWADETRDPAQDLGARYAIEQALDELAAARAEVADANHLLYLVRANQNFIAGGGDTYQEGLARIEAPTLMLYSERDLVFSPEGVRRTAQLIREAGNEVTLEPLRGDRGHLDGVLAIEQASDTLRAFLE
ncbi:MULTISPECIES: homoserine O-acetyltransferase [unclassified Halomonas]|uniref:E22 family MetX-like putative esterase n=1 Tax=unclassified Halomonas TaxID=2609666 RepID=UPI00209C8271|nr:MULTISPECIES: homoserine O-acetyltransferase [unclassified Halomonas]MCP1315102.1 homoserine O-acetyltransferase [Halomonas sp. 707D7]MCP1326217.1 homoserine O-acetyltransferase [Halomonas sp. 707D4]